MKKGIVLALAVTVSLVLSGVSFAEGGPGATPQKLESLNYPSKGIELVIPYAAGGAMDSTGRIFAKYAEKYTGQPISINNISGGYPVPFRSGPRLCENRSESGALRL